MGLDPLTISIGLAVASTATQVVGSARAAKEREKAGHAVRGSQMQAAQEQRRQKVREARVRRGRVVASSKASGTSGSSSEAGALNALTTSVASNLAFSRSQQGSAEAQSTFLQKSQDISDKTALVGSVFDLASTGIGLHNEGKKVKEL